MCPYQITTKSPVLFCLTKDRDITELSDLNSFALGT